MEVQTNTLMSVMLAMQRLAESLGEPNCIQRINDAEYAIVYKETNLYYISKTDDNKFWCVFTMRPVISTDPLYSHTDLGACIKWVNDREKIING